MKAPEKNIDLNRDDVKRYYSYLPDYKFGLTQYWESDTLILDYDLDIYISTGNFGFVNLRPHGKYSLRPGKAENGFPTGLLINSHGSANRMDYSIKIFIDQVKKNKNQEIDEIQLMPDGIVDRRSIIYKDFYIEVTTEIKGGKKYV